MIPRASNELSSGPPCSPDAATRTTFEIFSTCVSAMFICVWTAFHVEIPTRKRGAFGGFWHKLKWMLFGMFLPSWLSYLATSQLVSAVRLLNTVYCDLGAEVLPAPPDGWLYKRLLPRRYFARPSPTVRHQSLHDGPHWFISATAYDAKLA